MFIASASILILLKLCFAQTQTYCDPLLCPKGVRHVACGRRPNEYAATCPMDAIQVTNITFQNVILNEHNRLRNLLAMGNLKGFEPASRMPTLEWHHDLGNFTMIQARQCQPKKDDCRNTYEFDHVGQNFYNAPRSSILYNATQVIVEAIGRWFKQHETFTSKNGSISNYTYNQATSDFAQIITAKTAYIGCSMVQYTAMRKIQVNFFCDYSSEPKEGAAIYNPGESASQCKEGRNSKYPGLCAVREFVDPNYI